MCDFRYSAVRSLFLFFKNTYTEPSLLIEYTAWQKLWISLNGDISKGKFSPLELSIEYNLELSSDDDIYVLVFCLESLYAYIACQNRPGNNNENLLGIFSWVLKNDDFLKIIQREYLGNSIDTTSIQYFFKDLYEIIFPKTLRHRTGAFFTPTWAAEYVLKDYFSDGLSLNKKILEPNCGAGSFLIAIFKYIKQSNDNASNDCIFNFIKGNVLCFDKNPLSVLTTRIIKEWLLYFIDQKKKVLTKELMVYFADCINEFYYHKQVQNLLKCDIPISIAENVFLMDISDIENVLVNNILFEAIEKDIALSSIAEVKNTQQSMLIYDFLSNLFRSSSHVYSLYKEYIQTTYSNMYINKIDYILGNPPWINWEFLNKEYKARIEFIWPLLGLFSNNKTKIAFSKENIASLITYTVMDYYLKNNGKLGFFLPQSLLQSYSNSKGFRRFYLQNNDISLKVLNIKDFDKSKIFDGVTTKTIFLTLNKGRSTKFPIDYEKHKIKVKDSTQEISIAVSKYLAKPSIIDDVSSTWSILPKENNDIDIVQGIPAYQARAGVFTGGANAVYYQEILSYDDERYITKNVVERAKRAFPQKEMTLEKSLVYPFIRGRDLQEWHVDYQPCRAIIIPHTPESKMEPIELSVMKETYPYTYNYFDSARQFLVERKGLTAMDRVFSAKGFYNILRIGEYTFAEYKVAWRYIHTNYTCAVITPAELPDGSIKACIPQEKLMIIPCNSAMEAFFVCGYLSSQQISTYIESKMVSTQISAHLIKNVYIPEFDINNILHVRIATLCEQGHNRLIQDISSNISDLKEEISRTVAVLLEVRGGK
ncbi:hypothetical protein B9T10_07905 [Wohlfahrtiimonas chitiniclastica]|uniref:N-6 DNA methylase n=1 Tax=Wohlfahrtiimonas chitiniclastica TaxID=400946 RepID=UPI000B9843C9|nr:N-6 DNA methylase [Wohlfahrtiimonas chitiniclastica]OYQ87975.1 hypothetical protein B9T10_07905 [Wohlfahrtiimonas chitiniclastica]